MCIVWIVRAFLTASPLIPPTTFPLFLLTDVERTDSSRQLYSVYELLDPESNLKTTNVCERRRNNRPIDINPLQLTAQRKLCYL
jgi:hypothetical protein